MGIAEKINLQPNNLKIENIKNNAGKIEDWLIPEMKEICTVSFNDFWSTNGNPSTIEEMNELFKRLGTEVVLEIFDKHSAMQDFIEANDPSWQRLEPPHKHEVIAGEIRVKSNTGE